MQIDGGKVDSLHWAIEELSKQRQELDGKIKIARKREETGSLIEEVHAQKDALLQAAQRLVGNLLGLEQAVDTRCSSNRRYRAISRSNHNIHQ